MKVNIVTNHHEVSFWTFLLSLLSLATISSSILLSTYVSADGDSAVGQIGITVPIACTMSGTGMSSHNVEINNGQYNSAIGETVIKAVCNDNEGFAIYAAGYTGDEVGEENSNKLVGTTASSNATIESGIATAAGNPDISNWAMKLTKTQDSGDTSADNAFTIDSAPNVDLPSQAEQSATQASFSEYHVVPNEYVKVAHKNSGTDMTETTGGVKLTTAYAAYISKTQPADTYSGQVIYTLVHPSDATTPITRLATLDTGRIVNSKLKSVAATVVNGRETTINPTFDPYDEDDYGGESDSYIKSIKVHLKTTAPAGFAPSSMNTISASTSENPIYVVFDNTSNAGIMHFYTEGEQIILPTDASYMFYMFYKLTDFSEIAGWDTSNATNMDSMFYRIGYSSSVSFALDLSSWDTSSVTSMSDMFKEAVKTNSLNLSTWDTSNVTDMSGVFHRTGRDTASFTLNLSSWNTSSVIDMSWMFYMAGDKASTWSISNLSSWDTSNVTNMSEMFNGAGYNATTFALDLSSWDTSSVTSMHNMFDSAGYSATSFTLNLSSWNTSNVTSMYGMFSNAGYSATSFTLNLSSWNTSNVTSMHNMFDSAGYSATSFTLNLSSWNTSNVTDMNHMFSYAGYSATTWSIGDLSSWNTSNVKNMGSMFSSAGYSATSFTLNLSSWNTSNVTSMYGMFSNAGYSATSFTLNLSSWNTSNVTSMYGMFSNAGYSATSFTLNLSSWNTSNVTDMIFMFYNAGSSATTWSVTIPQTNGNSINNTTSRLYGKTTSQYETPPSGKSFTIAQP